MDASVQNDKRVPFLPARPTKAPTFADGHFLKIVAPPSFSTTALLKKLIFGHEITLATSPYLPSSTRKQSRPLR